MVKYLINQTNTVRLGYLADVEAFHEELKHNSNFELNSFSYTVKEIKQKSEVIGEYYIVKYKITFNNEKEPERQIEVEYNEI